jgi:thioredoxin reductase/NAD-dependent dihydropyrimidine dehydrogenase PreA subunit
VAELLTTVGFVLAAAIAVMVHVRRSASAGKSSRPCPRCGQLVQEGVLKCPSCSVPMQLFEVTEAAVVTEEANGDGGGRLHAVVRADVCVGCGTCVAACPETGAIRLDGKLAVVAQDACTGHGKCVEACPVGGILLTTGAMVHRVEVPDVRNDFQSNVPGLYVVGELGGRGLIKNAINEGCLAAENVAAELNGAAGRGGDDRLDVVVVGSGPAGISAGLAAKRAGLRVALVEQGTLADSIRKYPRRKLLLAEPVKVPLYGSLWVADAAKETLLQVWERIIANHELEIRTGCRVEEIAREGNAFVVSGKGFAVKARRVILALGRRGTPRRLGVPGEDGGSVFYDVAEMEMFRGRRVLVVGGGDSALESAVGMSNQPGAEVTLSYRKDTFDRAKERNVVKLAAAEQAGRLRVLRNSVVKRIDPGMVLLDVAGREVRLPADDVVIRIGGEPPSAFLEKVGIRRVTKEIPIQEAKEAVGA